MRAPPCQGRHLLASLLFAHVHESKKSPPAVSFRVGPLTYRPSIIRRCSLPEQHTKIQCSRKLKKRTITPAGNAPAARNIAPPSRPAAHAQACGMSSRRGRRRGGGGVRAWSRRGLSLSCQHGAPTPGRAHPVAAGKPLAGRTWRPRAEGEVVLCAPARGGAKKPGNTPPAAVRAMPRPTRSLTWSK
jgi:hypothetical protein